MVTLENYTNTRVIIAWYYKWNRYGDWAGNRFTNTLFSCLFLFLSSCTQRVRTCMRLTYGQHNTAAAVETEF